MRITSTHTVTTLAAAAALGAALAAGAPAVSSEPDGAEQRRVERLVEQARQYAGDPWEKRFRAQFWTDQHIHDSWNRCHLGENAPRPEGCDGSSLTPRP